MNVHRAGWITRIDRIGNVTNSVGDGTMVHGPPSENAPDRVYVRFKTAFNFQVLDGMRSFPDCEGLVLCVDVFTLAKRVNNRDDYLNQSVLDAFTNVYQRTNDWRINDISVVPLQQPRLSNVKHVIQIAEAMYRFILTNHRKGWPA